MYHVSGDLCHGEIDLHCAVFPSQPKLFTKDGIKYWMVCEPVPRAKSRHRAHVLQSAQTILRALHSPTLSCAPWVRPMPSTARRLQARRRSSSVKNVLVVEVGKSGRMKKTTTAAKMDAMPSRIWKESAAGRHLRFWSTYEQPAPSSDSSSTIHVVGDDPSEEAG